MLLLGKRGGLASVEWPLAPYRPGYRDRPALTRDKSISCSPSRRVRRFHDRPRAGDLDPKFTYSSETLPLDRSL